MGLSLLEFADNLNQLLPVVLKEFSRRQANELYKGKITLPQSLLLNFLEQKGQAKMTELARFMDVTTAAMTGIIDRLARDSYAARVPDPKDRRIIKVKITAKGAELAKRINCQRRQMIIEIFAKLSEAERQGYLRIIRHIHDVLIGEKRQA